MPQDAVKAATRAPMEETEGAVDVRAATRGDFTEGLGRTLARTRGVDQNLAPDHSTLCRYMNEDKFKQLKTLLATIHAFHKPTKLYLAVDFIGLPKRKKRRLEAR